MLASTLLAPLLATAAYAFPAAEVGDASSSLVARQSSSSTELENGACRPVTFIFARGSTEAGNMGTVVGGQTCAALKTRYGSNTVACQGVGGPYDAQLLPNTFPRGTTDAAIGEASRLFRLASTKCPSTVVISGGYSQGAAVMAGSLSDLQQQAPAVANKVAGVVLYGYTRNAQNGGRIPNFPTQKTKVFCAQGDLVCAGTLVIATPHYSYAANVGEATTFLAQRVAAAGGPA